MEPKIFPHVGGAPVYDLHEYALPPPVYKVPVSVIADLQKLQKAAKRVWDKFEYGNSSSKPEVAAGPAAAAPAGQTINTYNFTYNPPGFWATLASSWGRPSTEVHHHYHAAPVAHAKAEEPKKESAEDRKKREETWSVITKVILIASFIILGAYACYQCGKKSMEVGATKEELDLIKEYKENNKLNNLNKDGYEKAKAILNNSKKMFKHLNEQQQRSQTVMKVFVVASAMGIMGTLASSALAVKVCFLGALAGVGVLLYQAGQSTLVNEQIKNLAAGVFQDVEKFVKEFDKPTEPAVGAVG